MRHELTTGEYAGLRSMLKLALSGWIEHQLKPVEQHFADDAVDVSRDILERFLMYLVLSHGVKDPNKTIWYNVTQEQLNKVVGVDGNLTINDDQSITLIIKP